MKTYGIDIWEKKMKRNLLLCGVGGILLSMSSGCLIISTGGTTKTMPCNACTVEESVKCQRGDNCCFVQVCECSSAPYEAFRCIEGSIEFKRDDEFCVAIPRGTLTIQRWNKPCVAFTAKVQAYGQTQDSVQELVANTKMELKRNNSKVFIQYTAPEFKNGNEYVKADVIIHVPCNAPTTTRTGYGDMTEN